VDLGQEERNRVAEVTLSSRARRTLTEGDVRGLEEIRERYLSIGSTWDSARIGLELSAIYIGGHAYEQAVQVLRPTLAGFQEVGDDYGVDLAERNLAASLAAVPGHDAEVDELASRVERRSSDSIDSRRQKAWYNNILGRRYRHSGRLDDAEKVTKETIELSIELGEASLTALTCINLGNVYRDKKDIRAALDAYARAGTQAQLCGRRDIEADGTVRLSAR
jgi:tetratricopeptide (TPR) repeat protein